MRKTKLVVFSLLLAFGIALGYSQRVSANQAPSQSYCMTWGALHNLLISNWTAPLYLGVGCGLQPGDLYTDGSIYDSSLQSVSGLTFTIPANTFVAKGQRVVTQAQATSAPDNTTTYEWLDCNGCVGTSYGTWEATSSSTPPHTYSTLEYTIVTSSGSMLGYFPTYASLVLGSGLLQIGANNSSGYNQVVFTAGSPQPAQVVFYNNSFAGSMGGVPYFMVWANDTVDCTSTGPEHSIMIFKNGDGTPGSPVTIGCSTDTNPGDIEFALSVNGREQHAGPIVYNYGPTPGPSPSPSMEPACFAPNQPGSAGYLQWCLNGLQLAMLFQSNVGTAATGTGVATFADLYDTGGSINSCLGLTASFKLVSNTSCVNTWTLVGGWLTQGGTAVNPTLTVPWTPAPLATATPITFSNSSGGITTAVAANTFQETNAQCFSAGSLAADLVFDIQDKNGTSLFNVDCNGDLALPTLTPSTCLGVNGSHIVVTGNNCIKSVGVSGGWLTSSTISSGVTISTPWTPYPMATSASTTATNSSTGVTTVGLHTFQGTNAACGVGGSAALNLIFAIEDQAAVNHFKVQCNGAATFDSGVTVNNIKITGLSSSTSSPVCAPNNGNAIQCNVSTQANHCGTIDTTTGYHLECQSINNSSFTCAATTVCTVGTMTFASAFPDTNYVCNGNQAAGSTTYANRALNVGFLGRNAGSIGVVVSAPLAVSSINVTILVTCTE